VLATRDVRFLDAEVTTFYGERTGRDSVRNLLARCYRHLTDDVGVGEHGLMRMLQDDWNDALVNAWTTMAESKEVVEKSESVLNSAMAAYVFDYYACMLTYAGGNRDVTQPIRQKANDHRHAVKAQWTGEWFRRAWLGPTNGWLGEKCIWIEPQPWALIGESASEEQARTLIRNIDQKLRQVSPIGAIQLSEGPDQVQKGLWKSHPGQQVNGGIWPSLNQTLIWALANVDGAMAWDEWKTNSFARHAEIYPEIWYGTWSGPDVLNSALSQQPGATTGGKPFGWTDFPVLNMHTHACPLYALSKLIGVHFTARNHQVGLWVRGMVQPRCAQYLCDSFEGSGG
jgi:cellobiose phosphorylase